MIVYVYKFIVYSYNMQNRPQGRPSGSHASIDTIVEPNLTYFYRKLKRSEKYG